MKHHPDTDGIHLPGQQDIDPDDTPLTWCECVIGLAVLTLAIVCGVVAGYALINCLFTHFLK